MRYKLSLDWNGRIIDPEGISARKYSENPVVIYNHDYNLIVGKCVDIERIGGDVFVELDLVDVPFEYEVEYVAPDVRVLKSHINASGSDTLIIDECEIVSLSIKMRELSEGGSFVDYRIVFGLIAAFLFAVGFAIGC